MLDKIVEEAVRAKVREIAVVVAPGDAAAYAAVTDLADAEVSFIEQSEPRGYGHAVLCAREFTAGEPFLHFVGDHIYVNDSQKSCAEQVVEAAVTQQCAVSAVQVTREQPGLSPVRLGAKGGAEKVTLTVPQLPSHTHPYQGTTLAGDQSVPTSNVVGGRTGDNTYIEDAASTAMSSSSVGNTGGSSSHTNLQPFLCVHFIIALFGIYPSRN